MSEYDNTRTIALGLESRKQKHHPCGMGKANCCRQSAEITLTPGDQQVITLAIKTGAISSDTLERAISKSLAGPTNECGFLKPDGSCSIYAQRPLTCITYGNGGDCPINPEAIKTPRVPIEKVFLPLCNDCNYIARENWFSIPTQDIIDYRTVGSYINRQPSNTGMSSFLLGQIAPTKIQLPNSQPVTA